MADMTSGNTVPDRYVVVIGGLNDKMCVLFCHLSLLP